MSKIERDDEYDFVPPLPETERGTRCGECGLKFEYNTFYAYSCPRLNCPCGYGPLISK